MWLKDDLIELSAERWLKLISDGRSQRDFWHITQKEFKELSGIAIRKLLPFPSTYLCEQDFSALTSIKTKNRNRIDTEPCLILTISNIHL
jgi:hypothetical protein